MFGSLLKHGLKHGRIHLIDHHGRGQTYGSGAPEITLRLHDGRVGWEMALNPWLKLGEAYMDGRFTIEKGSIYDLIDIGLAKKDTRQDGINKLTKLGEHEAGVYFTQGAVNKQQEEAAAREAEEEDTTDEAEQA